MRAHWNITNFVLMINAAVFVVGVALLSAFVLSVFNKWGWIEWAQVHTDGLIYEMLTCRFCLSFWTAILICLIYAIFTGVWIAMLAPVFSCNLTKWIW